MFSNIKIVTYVAIAQLFGGALLAEDVWEPSPVSGDDLVEMLELRLDKYTVKYDEPKFVTLRFEAFGQSSEWTLEEPQKKVTITIYEPKQYFSPEKPKEFAEIILKIHGETTGHAITSGGQYGKSKVKIKNVKLAGGLEIVAKESKESDGFVYRLKVVTSSERPSKAK